MQRLNRFFERTLNSVQIPKRITIDGRERQFLISAKSSSDQLRPVVIVLHGGGSKASEIRIYSQFDRVAEREGFIAVYPESVGGNWNDGRRNDFSAAQREQVDDVKFIRAVIDNVAKEHPVDCGRIFSTGISNGGITSHRLAARLPIW